MSALKDKNQLRRIFFHELGHYFAFKLSNKHIPDFGIEEILIYPCVFNPNYLCGHTKPIIPKGIKNDGKIQIDRLTHFFIKSILRKYFSSRIFKS